MSLMDGILITLFNTVACLVFPKLLSVVLATKKAKKRQVEPQITVEPQISIATAEPSPEIPSFS
ncbi:MAG TPA: hypothetical protein VK203_25680 [Nostocaceae cyanobacterium]|nr:hypothetical protein [Nostocaceae cyanobacterium]